MIDVKDRVVQFANRYKLTSIDTGEELGTFDFTEVPGTVQEAGTEINAALFESINADIIAESTARAAADKTLQANITAEENARLAADSENSQAIILEAQTRAQAIIAVTSKIDAHEERTDNPHGVTKSQVGLGNVDNVKQYSASNPPPYPVRSVAGKTGAVTLVKGDVGLGNVDNTSDASKPVSTAQATAIADAKKAGTDAQDTADEHIARTDNPHSVTAAQIGAATNEALTTETNARKAADNALQEKINSETAERTDSDNSLKSRIDDIENGVTAAGNALKLGGVLASEYAKAADVDALKKQTFFGTCSTSVSTVAKVVSINGFTAENLVNGTKINVYFTYSNLASSPTLNVSGTGAKLIVTQRGNSISASSGYWASESIVSLVYYNNTWRIQSPAKIATLNGSNYFAGDREPTIYAPTTAGDSDKVLVGGSTPVWKDLIDLVYPVGAVYISLSSTSPASLFGGSWAKISDRFLLAAGTTYTAGNTGGETSVTLKTEQIPSHGHGQNIQVFNASYGEAPVLPDRTAYWSSDKINVLFEGKQVDHVAAFDGPGTSSAGGGQAHENMPPYYVVYMWRRTA